MLRLARFGSLLLALACGAGEATAQVLLHEVPRPSGGKRAERGPFDLDGDGKGDFLFGGRVYSGADASLMLDITQAAGRTNIAVAAVSDLAISGDGVVDFVAIKIKDSSGSFYAPDLYAVSGADGSLLLKRRLGSAQEVGQFVRNVGDADGDGWEDLIAGTAWFEGPCWYEKSQVAVVSGGGSFNPVYFNARGQNVSYILGAPLGDINGDGLTEFAVGGSCGNGQEVYTMSSGTALPMRFLSYPTVTSDEFMAAVGDFDGDGRDDYARPVFLGTIAIASGADPGSLLQVFPVDHDRERFTGIAAPGDVDCDGVPDLLTTLWKTRLYSGRDARLLWTAPETALRVVEVGDVDGDGRPDLGLELRSKMQIWSAAGLGDPPCTPRRERAPETTIPR